VFIGSMVCGPLQYMTLKRIFYLITGVENVFGPKLKKYSRIKDYPLDSPRFNEHFNKELFKSHIGGLVNLLHYGDAISMSKSMESRNPFLDVKLVEFSFKLPFYFKIHNGLNKYIHIISMKNIVPKFILENPISVDPDTGRIISHLEEHVALKVKERVQARRDRILKNFVATRQDRLKTMKSLTEDPTEYMARLAQSVKEAEGRHSEITMREKTNILEGEVKNSGEEVPF